MTVFACDAELTARGIDTKVVFLVFNDTLWAPLHETLQNPDRFVMLIAPITRRYDKTYDQLDVTKEYPVPPYEKNKTVEPDDLESFLGFYKSWQSKKGFENLDAAVYDYHLIWPHLRDPGYYAVSQILFRDMQALHKVGWNGMVSCQVTRCAFPTNLPMQMMADALWDETCDFEIMSSRYFDDAFGADGPAVKAYMKAISDHMDPEFPSRYPASPEGKAKKVFDPETRIASMLRLKALVEEFGAVIEGNLRKPLPAAQRKSWEYLIDHKDYVNALADTVIAGVSESEEVLASRIDGVRDWLLMKEPELHKVMDARVAANNMDWIYKQNVKVLMHE